MKANDGARPILAEARIVSINNSGVSGLVRFRQEREAAPTIITGFVTGLTPGEHGFHIHLVGDLSRNCLAAGPHYNPFSEMHGSPFNPMRHAGDLGNIVAGPVSVIGRTLVVHMNRDDLGLGTGAAQAESKLTGNAGRRIGCGIIVAI
ncbi:unnamed protein product [Dracunculus medinensis]|uniref:Superoxide dismutase [Cu-Zn] n=1 Tax=Dracunculus medinensis TaxID=318479 RepID=A0A0N4UNI5_DRAME|nr:unnamed protein product [Dracunculus medinensis]